MEPKVQKTLVDCQLGAGRLQLWLLSCTVGSTALIPLHGCVRREHEHFLESTLRLMCYGTNPITAKGKNT